MLLTIERIHNLLEKQHTENRSLLVATCGKDLTAFSPVEKISHDNILEILSKQRG
ncbi:hypothetical protein ACSAZL_07305 [Methanosarcina sp. T3]|uniref:hypothetical protein n=1 Tax=Methanosarcina sp. T3 TaxID=3439062 RepID=UPI003F851E4D